MERNEKTRERQGGCKGVERMWMIKMESKKQWENKTQREFREMNGARGRKKKECQERRDVKNGKGRKYYGIADLRKSDLTVSLCKHVSRYHGEPKKQILQQISSMAKIKCDELAFQRKDKCDKHVEVNPRPLH